MLRKIVHRYLIYLIYICTSWAEEVTENYFKTPTVGVAVLVRNKFHTLPYFLSCVDNLNYPKDRMYLW